MKVMMMPFKGELGKEIRPLFFYRAFNMTVPSARIISFGSCNFCCPYCKRDGMLRTREGNIVNAIKVDMENVLRICDDAIAKAQIIRLSGGDPALSPRASLKIGEYIKERNGRLSIAHNGSSPAFINRMVNLLESAAIDLKATPDNMAMVTGLNSETGKKMYHNSLQIQSLLLSQGLMVDIRTPVFGCTVLDDLLYLVSDISKLPNVFERGFWTLRLYEPIQQCNMESPNEDNVLWMIEEIKKEYPKLKIGLRAKWNSEGFLYF